MKKLLLILLLLFPVHGAWGELTKEEAFKKLSKKPGWIEGVWSFSESGPLSAWKNTVTLSGEILILRSKNYQKNYQYDIYNINIFPGRWLSGVIVGNLIRTAEAGVFLGEMKNGYWYNDANWTGWKWEKKRNTIWYQAKTQFNLNSFHKISYVFKKHDTGVRTTQDNVRIITNEITGTITKIYPLEKPVIKKPVSKPTYKAPQKEKEKTWLEKLKDKRQDKAYHKDRCARQSGKAKTTVAANRIYNSCMEKAGY